MKKIININFHSRVIPIEETAYDILRKYVESLKKYFAAEEGGDEIVNDIENRFAELFSDRLKKGATCITDDDVNEIITSMGRPEDFDQDENPHSEKSSYASASAATEEGTTTDARGRLYRSENDKMLGGVCGGLAAYLRIDPSVVRIIYAILILGSFGTALLLYVVLWVVLPPKSLVVSIKKRLFRDADHRVIGGVAGGLAAYFNIEVWIPRVIFCLPLIAGTLASIFRHDWFDYGGPVFFTGGFGGTLFVTYIILWIVLPEATTASEKLEMRGEKIDLESIKNTIKNDMEGFRQKATVVGSEIKDRATQFGNEMKSKSGSIRKDISSVNIPRQGIGHAIGVLFKAFFLFISVVFTFALVMALIGLIFTGAGIMPLKGYFINGFWQNLLAWGTVILFLILPVVGLLTWLIRRIIGVRRSSAYLGYIFGGLWVIGWICMICLVATVSQNFSTRSGVNDDIEMSAPIQGKLVVKIDQSKPFYFDSDFMGMNWRHKGPFFDITEDSLTLNTVRVNVVKSTDTAWHVHREKMSHGNSTTEARQLASEINFQINQKDSFLLLSRGFTIQHKQQFRNQQVVVVIEVPVGKKILLSENLDDYHWFNITRHSMGSNQWNISGDFDSDWESDVEYIMTDHGLERTGHMTPEKKARDKQDSEEDDNTDSDSSNNKVKDGYRYHKVKLEDKTPANKKESVDIDGNPSLILMTRLS